MFQFFLSSLPRVTLTAPVATGTGAGVNPSETIGTVTLVSPIGTGTGTVVTPTETLGAVTETAPVATGTGAGITPSEIIGTVTLISSVGTGTGSAIVPTETIGSVTLVSPVGTGTGAGIDPSETIGTVTIAPPIATGIGTAPSVAVTVDVVTMVADVGVGLASATAPDETIGAVTISPEIALGGSSAIFPEYQLGRVTIACDVGEASGSIINPVTVVGIVSLVPDVGTGVAIAIQPLLLATNGTQSFHVHASFCASYKVLSYYADAAIRVTDSFGAVVEVSHTSCLPVMMARVSHKASYAVLARVYIMDNLDERYFIVNGSFAVTISVCARFSEEDLSAKAVTWALKDVATDAILADGSADYVGTETDASTGRTLYVFRATLTAAQAASMELRKSYAVDFSEPTTGLGKRVGPRTAAFY